MGEIPDARFYQKVFSPWLGYGEFPAFYEKGKNATLVGVERCWILYSLLLQARFVEGDFWECGVYKGGTAAMIAQFLHDKAPFKKLHLFDTFEGMPKTDMRFDLHLEGDFIDTSLQQVMSFVGFPDFVIFHKGAMPGTFQGLHDSRIAFAHIDVDIWRSIIDCCEFVFPRLSVGGFLLFDDYGFPSCPGARNAVDMFFRDREAVPLVLGTGQAIVFKSR